MCFSSGSVCGGEDGLTSLRKLANDDDTFLSAFLSGGRSRMGVIDVLRVHYSFNPAREPCFRIQNRNRPDDSIRLLLRCGCNLRISFIVFRCASLTIAGV